MVKPATIRVDGSVLQVISSHGRTHSVVMVLSAFALMVLPFVYKYLPDGLIEIEEGQEPWMLYLFAIVACLSAAFWWSVVTIDPEADQVVIRRRWGLWCSERRRALSSYDLVTLRADSDCDVSVYLENSNVQDCSIETNNDKAIVWGRTYDEAREIATLVAKHLVFRLQDYVAAESVTAHSV
jgi:hypothetical protein